MRDRVEVDMSRLLACYWYSTAAQTCDMIVRHTSTSLTLTPGMMASKTGCQNERDTRSRVCASSVPGQLRENRDVVCALSLKIREFLAFHDLPFSNDLTCDAIVKH
ncbi:hypothetical protein MRB53_040340 [Persea americana]|nr:hypothetical protein MRB53_040340 [Persea americana]